jgi:hypothetical protein
MSFTCSPERSSCHRCQSMQSRQLRCYEMIMPAFLNRVAILCNANDRTLHHSNPNLIITSLRGPGRCHDKIHNVKLRSASRLSRVGFRRSCRHPMKALRRADDLGILETCLRSVRGVLQIVGDRSNSRRRSSFVIVGKSFRVKLQRRPSVDSSTAVLERKYLQIPVQAWHGTSWSSLGPRLSYLVRAALY